jgi:hypothetical protein
LHQALAWILLGSPLAAAAASCVGFVQGWKSTSGRVRKVFAVGLATVAALYGCGCLVYVDVVGPMPAFDYSLEEFGFLLSLAAVISGFIGFPPFEWYSTLALAVSGWLLLLFFLMALTF